MREEEIIEGNKLIAKFIGAVFINDAPDDYPNGYYLTTDEEESGLPLLPEEWMFHKLWDWLMPVVEKIEIDNSAVSINNTECMIVHFGKPEDTPEKDFGRTFSSGETKIETTWIAVVEFIKWYNAEQKPR